ncbi:unnamed protein product [Sympodiomycopsis kandeliae]
MQPREERLILRQGGPTTALRSWTTPTKKKDKNNYNENFLRIRKTTASPSARPRKPTTPRSARPRWVLGENVQLTNTITRRDNPAPDTTSGRSNQILSKDLPRRQVRDRSPSLIASRNVMQEQVRDRSPSLVASRVRRRHREDPRPQVRQQQQHEQANTSLADDPDATLVDLISSDEDNEGDDLNENNCPDSRTEDLRQTAEKRGTDHDESTSLRHNGHVTDRSYWTDSDGATDRNEDLNTDCDSDYGDCDFTIPSPSRKHLAGTMWGRIPSKQAQKIYKRHIYRPHSFDQSDFPSTCVEPKNTSKYDKYVKINTRHTKSAVDDTLLEKSVFGHHLALVAVSRGQDLSGLFISDKDTRNQVSHLCHNTYCCNPNHLVVEPDYVNKKRNACRGSTYLTFRGKKLADYCHANHEDSQPCILNAVRLEDVLKGHRDELKCRKCGEAWASDDEEGEEEQLSSEHRRDHHHQKQFQHWDLTSSHTTSHDGQADGQDHANTPQTLSHDRQEHHTSPRPIARRPRRRIRRPTRYQTDGDEGDNEQEEEDDDISTPPLPTVDMQATSDLSHESPFQHDGGDTGAEETLSGLTLVDLTQDDGDDSGGEGEVRQGEMREAENVEDGQGPKDDENDKREERGAQEKDKDTDHTQDTSAESTTNANATGTNTSGHGDRASDRNEKRGRGRPRKNASPSVGHAPTTPSRPRGRPPKATVPATNAVGQSGRGRGRPRKSTPAAPVTPSRPRGRPPKNASDPVQRHLEPPSADHSSATTPSKRGRGRPRLSESNGQSARPNPTTTPSTPRTVSSHRKPGRAPKSTTDPPAPTTPGKRPRGRPRKSDPQDKETTQGDKNVESERPAKRPRGRPPKDPHP